MYLCALLVLHKPQQIGMNPVVVTRTPYRNGYRWSVTFQAFRGDLGMMTADPLLLIGDAPSVVVTEKRAGSADIYPGQYTLETQSIVALARDPATGSFDSSVPTGSFVLSFEGQHTAAIDVTDSAEVLKHKLEAITALHCAEVRRDTATGPWRVRFAWRGPEVVPGAGGLGLLLVVPPAAPTLLGNEAHVAVSRMVRGTHPFDYTLSGLTLGETYYARVAAHTSRGMGPFSGAAVSTPRSQPAPPTNVTLSVASGTALTVQWSPPAGASPGEVTSYTVEWFSDPQVSEVQMVTTSAQQGVAEVQTVTSRADADNLGGAYTLSFEGYTTAPIAWNAPAIGLNSVKEALERLPSLGEVSVTQDYSQTAVIGLLVDVNAGDAFCTQSAASLHDFVQAGIAVNDLVWIAGFQARVLAVTATQLDFGEVYDNTVSASYDGTINLLNVGITKGAYGFEYTVTLSSYNGDAPALVAKAAAGWSGTNPSLTVAEVTAGIRPTTGTFRLGYGLEATPPLPHDVSAADMESALERVLAVGDVSVSRVSQPLLVNHTLLRFAHACVH
jgi:Fibronectin type III domain